MCLPGGFTDVVMASLRSVAEAPSCDQQAEVCAVGGAVAVEIGSRGSPRGDHQAEIRTVHFAAAVEISRAIAFTVLFDRVATLIAPLAG